MYLRFSIIVSFIFCASLNAGVARIVMLEKKSLLKGLQQVYLISVDGPVCQELNANALEEKTYEASQDADELFYWFDQVKTYGGKKFLLDSRYPYDGLYAKAFAPLHFCQCLVQGEAECLEENEQIIKAQLRQKDITKPLQALGKRAEGKSDVYYISRTITELEASLSSLKGYDSVFDSTLRQVHSNCVRYARDKGFKLQEFLEKIEAQLNDFVRVLRRDSKLLKNKKQKITIENLINFIESESKRRFHSLSDGLNEFDRTLKEQGAPILTVQGLMIDLTYRYIRSGVLKEAFTESHNLFAQIAYPNQMAAYYALEHILDLSRAQTVFCASESSLIHTIQEILIGEGYTVVLDSHSMFNSRGIFTLEKGQNVFLTNELIAKFFYRSFEQHSQKQEL